MSRKTSWRAEPVAPLDTAGRGAQLFTIGHSNHAPERFLDLLRCHGIGIVADVRSRPYSRFVPQFSKERLARALSDSGIAYLFLGRELGGKPPTGETSGLAPDYADRVRQPEFLTGIERLLAAARARRVAMLCRERDPLDCHRLHLICRYLQPLAREIRHILPDGTLQAQDETERRLLERVGGAQGRLFESGDPIERAYDAWWQRSR